jgi:hypothetical protein
LSISAKPLRQWRSGSVPQRVGVNQRHQRLVERAHQILALRQVDGDLAANAGVDLRQ